jgi:DEAD/DEAH box helicase domain-containing protein
METAEASEFFCQKCGRIKKRCICKKGIRREKNLRLFREISGESKLKPLFDTDDEIAHYKVFEPYNPMPSLDLGDDLPNELIAALESRGIKKLYSFQKRAIDVLRSGKNAVITAPTGFGKTEAFVIPMIERIAKEGGKGIIIYPTKALAADQEIKIRYYGSSAGLEVTRFDGDSAESERRDVFVGRSDIILSNPDMIDYHLRNTESFRRVVRDLKFLAVDELHYYTGVLGTNLYYLVKRLSRFSDFQIASASATISNAEEFATALFDRDFIWIDGEHRKGRMHLVMRCSPNIYSSLREIVRAVPDRKVIVFGNSYKAVETFAWLLNREGIKAAVHKGGLTKDVRSFVENYFRSGKINVVVSTSTLELGVDIGDVDVVVSELVNYPQFQQRVGRAGRMGQESIGVLLMREDDAISNYYREFPEEYFKSENFGYVERYNEEIMKYQILSMVIERPLQIKELDEKQREILKLILLNGFAQEFDGVILPTQKGIEIMRNFSMRGIGESIKMIKDGRVIGERVLPVAIKEMFPGSILIHNGERLLCTRLDMDKKEAHFINTTTGYITFPLYTSIPVILDIEDEMAGIVHSCYCSMEITINVFGYVEKDIHTYEKKRVRYLDDPVSYTFKTKGFLFSAPFPESMEYDDYFAGSFHALEHVLIETSDIITGGGSAQMGGISTPEGDIFVYDASFGGSGLSKLLFKRLQKAFKISLEVLEKCSCNRVEGCPRCTYSYQCGNNNTPLNRIGAISIIRKINRGLKRETDVEKYRNVCDFKYFP